VLEIPLQGLDAERTSAAESREKSFS
jgi:hypothetical protein